MLFNSIEFLFFFPVTVIIYFLLSKNIRNYWLLIVSYFFYMCWNPKYIVLLFSTTVITYVSGLLLEKTKSLKESVQGIDQIKKAIVAVSFVINLGLLFYFKYINFAIDLWIGLFSRFGMNFQFPQVDVVLPVGISFFTFQALSYTMDVYRDDIYAEKNFFKYALFVSFFPQLVAGPIERSKNLLRQLAAPGVFNADNVRDGLLEMFWGYFLKLVIADRCAVLVDTVYNDVHSYTGVPLIVASVLFALQIYCDFMSYSIIAQGAAKVLGYRLMDNFNIPYFSTSVKEFWRRWHISLSSWLRDYLYFPLGGSRKGFIRTNINVLITFTVSGLWHGAALTFVCWGFLHGIYLVIENIINKVANIDKNRQIGIATKIIKIVFTFILVDLAWVLFRANSLSDANYIFANLLRMDSSAEMMSNITQLGLGKRDAIFLFIGALVLFISSLMRENGIKLRDWVFKQHFILRYLLYWECMFMIVFSMDITGQEFIYFQF